MKVRYFLLYLLISASLLTGCAPNIEPPLEFGYNFIPIDTGRYYIYDVDSMYFDCTAVPQANDTFHYQIKEFYPYTFVDGMGDTVVCCTRYYRTDTTQPWAITGGTNVWWIKRTTSRFEKREENLTYVKMTYPIDEDYSWDGNAYNPLGQQEYYYGSRDLAFNNGILSFDSTITVYQMVDTITVLKYNYCTETYARNIGMIHKLKILVPQAIVYDQNDAIVPADACEQNIPAPYDWYQFYILDRIHHGTIVEYKLREYGFE